MRVKTTHELNSTAFELYADKVNRLVRKAKKIGVEPIKVDVLSRKLKQEYLRGDGSILLLEDNEEPPAGYEPTGCYEEYVTFTVEGHAPKYNGWELVAVLQPMDVDGHKENLVRTVPGYEVPARFRQAVGTCDHCHVNRFRVQTFVVRHESGQYKAVGRSCLADFLGHADPHQLADYAFSAAELSEVTPDEDNAPHGKLCWKLELVLTVTAGLIQKFGWVSRREAENSFGRKVATADLLEHVLCSLRGKSEQDWREAKEILALGKQQLDLVRKTIKWAKSLQGKNTYEQNINLLARAGYVDSKSLGLVASMLQAYAKEAELTESGAHSQYVGEPGQKIETTVKVLRVIPRESYYGTMAIHVMEDGDGNQLVWFASPNGRWLEAGETYKITARVKGHSERHGVKQTKVTHVRAK